MNMKKKMIGILVVALFIISALSGISTGINDYKMNLGEEIMFTSFDEPTVVITSPEDGAIVSEPQIDVAGYASGEIGIAELGYTVVYPGGGTYAQSSPIDPPAEYYEFSFTIDILEGAEGNLITVFAIDTLEYYGFDSVTVIYDTDEDQNNPPDPPTDPSPGDGARLVGVKDVVLSWFCLDPDIDDDVYYKILFEADDSIPDVIVSWQNSSSFNLVELEPNTHYYWQIIADDRNGGIAEGPIWDFTTRDVDPPEAYFITPKENHLYIFGRDVGFIGKTIIIGHLDVEIYADDTAGIYSAKFYVDDELQARDFYSPYTFRLSDIGFCDLKVNVSDGQFNTIEVEQKNTIVFMVESDPRIDLVAYCDAGDDVPSIKNNGLKHFVSPLKGYNPPDDPDKVEVVAYYDLGTRKPIPTFGWVVPPGVTTSGDSAYVPRNNPGKYVVKGELVAGGNVVAQDTIVVWIVKSEITRDTGYAFGIGTKDTGRGLRMWGEIGFIHTIKPSTIFMDADRPNLTGSNNLQPPWIWREITSINNSGMTLDGGANKKWDNSRQVRTKSSFTNIPDWIKKWVYSEKYGSRWKSYEKWPTDADSDDIGGKNKYAVGNDDKSTNDETNDPYSNPGKLIGHDNVSRYLPHVPNKKCLTAKVQLHLQFREFTRLEIGDKWYRISDYYNWRVFLKYKPKFVNPNTIWEDDGSVIETNHNDWN